MLQSRLTATYDVMQLVKLAHRDHGSSDEGEWMDVPDAPKHELLEGLTELLLELQRGAQNLVIHAAACSAFLVLMERGAATDVQSGIGSKKESEALLECASVSQLVTVAEEAQRLLPHGFAPFTSGSAAAGQGAVAMLLAGVHAGVDWGTVQESFATLMRDLPALKERQRNLRQQVRMNCGHRMNGGESVEDFTFREAAELKLKQLQAAVELTCRLRWDRLIAIRSGAMPKVLTCML